MALTVESTPVEQPPRAPYWTLHDYHQAIDAGVFGDRRVELINGTLYEMPPMREPHIGATNHLVARFYTLGEKRVRSQMPIVLPENGEPEPDIAVVDADAPLKPSVQHVQLVIEVSYATRQFDRGVKLEAYLAAGLPEVWIIDLVEQCALVYRAGVLAGRFTHGAHTRLTAERVPEVTIDLDALFAAAGLPHHRLASTHISGDGAPSGSAVSRTPVRLRCPRARVDERLLLAVGVKQPQDARW